MIVPAVLVIGILGLAAYFVVTALQARRSLMAAKADVTRVKADLVHGEQAAAGGDLARAQEAVIAAQRRTGSPLWSAAATVPLVGTPFDTVRGIAATAHDLTTDVLPDVVTAAKALSPDRLRVSGDRINVAALARAAPTLTRADSATVQAERKVRALAAGWLSPVSRARQQFLDLLTELRSTLDDSTVAARLVPPMLGADGPRRYILVFENDAEARGLGGLPGAFAILRADHGRISFERFGTDSDLHTRATVNLGAEFNQRYGGFGVEDVFQNSDMSPHESLCVAVAP